MAAPKFFDRVEETTATVGAGDYTLGGALVGYQSVSSVLSDGDTANFCTEGVDANGVPNGGWEVVLGTYHSAGGTITRTTVKASSNAGAAVVWGAGTKRIYITLPAQPFTSGSIVFQGVNGLQEDNANFFYSTSTPGIGIGTSSPLVSFHAVSNATVGFVSDCLVNSSQAAGLLARKGRGTSSAPLRTQINDNIGIYNCRGYTATTDVAAATVSAINTGFFGWKAFESFTTSAQGTTFQIQRTLGGTITPQAIFLANEDQNGSIYLYPRTNLATPTAGYIQMFVCVTGDATGAYCQTNLDIYGLETGAGGTGPTGNAFAGAHYFNPNIYFSALSANFNNHTVYSFGSEGTYDGTTVSGYGLYFYDQIANKTVMTFGYGSGNNIINFGGSTGAMHVAFQDGGNLIFSSSTGTKIGTAATQKIGFFNATPVVQPTDGATLTNNVTSGGTTNQIDDITSLVVYATDAATIRNDIYQLAKKMKIVVDNLRVLGLES